VIATHPPIFPGLLGYVYARLARVPFVLDSHIMGFGFADDRLSQVTMPIHSWLARRAAATLVTGGELAEIVRGWGGRPLAVHEPPVDWPVEPPASLGGRPRVLFTGLFARDEPVDLVLEAARALPEADVEITGDVRLAPAGLVDSAPPNARFLGFLPGPAFGDAVRRADVVLTLSTERVSVMRTAYEAVYAERPLVLSDGPMVRELFPYAVFVELSPEAVAEGLRTAIVRHAELATAARSARELQERRWDEQLAALAAVVTPQ
jgi:glycosyltransferase involved in cell wall biosynthesis